MRVVELPVRGEVHRRAPFLCRWLGHREATVLTAESGGRATPRRRYFGVICTRCDRVLRRYYEEAT